MKYLKGESRQQLVLFSDYLDDIVDIDNPVRFIDVFVDKLDIEKMGFRVDYGENGRPAYHPRDLIKLYIYGYLNRTRSSRQLERATKINIEVMWLLKKLSPDHNTIANFRKDNPKAIKKVFKATVSMAKNLDLIGAVLIAGDGTKMRAQNSKKNNYNQKKIDRHIAYIDNKLEQYFEDLNTADANEKVIIKKKIEKQKKNKLKYKTIENEIKTTKKKQVSKSDPDSRLLLIRGNITEVSYNIQATSDSKNKILLDYDVTNENDKNAMTKMVKNTIKTIGRNDFRATFDKGYYNAKELNSVQNLGVTTYVCIPNPSNNAPNKSYNVSEFIYNKTKDIYVCPEGKELKTNNKFYKNKNKRYKVKKYKTSYCNTCKAKILCTSSKRGREISRSEFAESVEINKSNIENNPEIYTQRQSLIEHPFGTIKRSWGFDYIITKKTKKVASSDVGFMFIAYNLKRIMNIIGIEKLIEISTYFLQFLLLKRAKTGVILLFSEKITFKIRFT